MVATIRETLISGISGWRIFFRQSVLPAGMAMAFLWFTVLGFDGITIGYAFAQGMKENIIAILQVSVFCLIPAVP